MFLGVGLGFVQEWGLHGEINGLVNRGKSSACKRPRGPLPDSVSVFALVLDYSALRRNKFMLFETFSLCYVIKLFELRHCPMCLWPYLLSILKYMYIQRESSHSAVHSPDAYNSLMSGVWNSSQVSHVDSENPATWALVRLLPRVCISSTLESAA